MISLLTPITRALAGGASRRMLLVAALASVAATGATYAQNAADPVVARVDGAEIKASDLAIAEEEVGSQMPPMGADQKREYLVTYLTDMLLVAKAAEDKKVADDPAFKRRLAYMRNKLLMESLLHEEVKSAMTDEAMHKVYDDATKQMGGEQEVHAHHILVETEDEAKAVLAELKKGTDFEALAKLKSKDPGAQAEGGDLGYFTKDQMVPEFAEVAFKLDKGQLSDPVKSQFGWHVIRVDDKRERPIPPFDQVKDQIQTFVSRKAQGEVITKLRQTAKIERLDKPADAKPAAPAQPAQPEKK